MKYVLFAKIWFVKISTRIACNLGLRKYEKLSLLDALKIHFQRFFALNYVLHLIINGLIGVDINSWTRLWVILSFCVLYLVKTQPFDSIKCTIIRKLAYKAQYISEISRGLIMFFGNLGIRYF